MSKINIGLIGIILIIIIILGSSLHLNSKYEKLYEELTIIKSYLIDIDNDINEIEEKKEKWKKLLFKIGFDTQNRKTFGYCRVVFNNEIIFLYSLSNSFLNHYSIRHCNNCYYILQSCNHHCNIHLHNKNSCSKILKYLLVLTYISYR